MTHIESRSSGEWEYIGYEKIPDNINKLQLTESDYRLFKKTEWVVTEKIHGANFGIVTDGLEVRFAKRKEFLEARDNFFDYFSLKNDLEKQALEIFNILQADIQDLRKITIYGELFGGEYPHPDVPKVSHIQAVQTGVYYSFKIAYCAFDIALETRLITYLDYDKALNLLNQVSMMAAQPLFMGKYEDAVAYNIEFESTIPALFGLPKLPFPNKAEGVVIKPVKSFYLETPKGKFRPVIKQKISEFAEDSRYHQATNWSVTPNQAVLQELSIEEELSMEMLALVTANRLNNVISKLGRVDAGNICQKQQLVQLLMADVLESFYEDYGSIFLVMSADSQEIMINSLREKSEKLVDSLLA